MHIIIKTKKYEYQTTLIKRVYDLQKNIVLSVIHNLFNALVRAPIINKDSNARFVLKHLSEKTGRTKKTMNDTGLSFGLERIIPCVSYPKSQATAHPRSSVSKPTGLNAFPRTLLSTQALHIVFMMVLTSTRMAASCSL